MQGTVKFFNPVKGFGFITGEDGKDYFVHISAIPEGVELKENDAVTFEPTEGDRGIKAENVALGGDGAGSVKEDDSQEEEASDVEEESEEEPEEASDDEEVEDSEDFGEDDEEKN